MKNKQIGIWSFPFPLSVRLDFSVTPLLCGFPSFVLTPQPNCPFSSTANTSFANTKIIYIQEQPLDKQNKQDKTAISL